MIKVVGFNITPCKHEQFVIAHVYRVTKVAAQCFS